MASSVPSVHRDEALCGYLGGLRTCMAACKTSAWPKLDRTAHSESANDGATARSPAVRLLLLAPAYHTMCINAGSCWRRRRLFPGMSYRRWDLGSHEP